MNRRCTSGKCLLSAQHRSRGVTLDLPVANLLLDAPKEWNKVARGNTRVAGRNLDVDWKTYNSDNYIFSHCSIVCSVNTEDNGYYIKPPCNELINTNGNGWTTPVLLSTFKSFVGAENYYEHQQVPELSKGKILDAVLRPVKYKGKEGGEEDVYFCDILVGTSKRHSGLVRDIQAGKMTTMSMGCVAHYITCSKCGKVIGDNEGNCSCLDNEILSYFTDENGIKRIVAELCGRTIVGSDGVRVGDQDSMRFIEASWVGNPAWKAAVLNHYIGDIPKEASVIMEMSTDSLQSYVDDLFKMRVADRWGMMVLRLAREEYLRRKHLAMIDRVAGLVKA